MSVFLRKATIEDGKYIVNWRKYDKVSQHFMDKSEITLESNAEFFTNYVTTGKYIQFMVEVAVEDYQVSYPIATVYLKNIDLMNKRCELGLFPNDENEWNDSTKVEALKLLLNVAFDEYGINKVYTYVIERCDDELKLVKKVGFIEEGILINELNDKGVSQNVIRFGICRT